MYVKRFLEAKIRKYLTDKEIIALVGPRQSGKTTLLKHIFDDLKKAIYLSFEDREVLRLFNEQLPTFIKLYIQKYDYVFIDEFQYAVEGGKQLKYIYDNHSTKIIVTGSSVSDLSIRSIKYLVGRILVFTLYPFSFHEFLSYVSPDLFQTYKKIGDGSLTSMMLPFFREYCTYGGYPRVVLTQDEDKKKEFLKNIYSTYLLKEIRDILQIQDDLKLEKLMRALALQIGSLVQYKELADVSGFSQKEVIHYCSILEKTFVCMSSKPFFKNKRLELVKAPKYYFLDMGFLNILLGQFQDMDKRQDKGVVYENFIASELSKAEIDLHYWRTKSQAEVDFVVGQGNIPLDVKSKKTVVSKSLHSFIAKYSPKKAFILGESHFEDKKKVYFRPHYMISGIIKKICGIN